MFDKINRANLKNYLTKIQHFKMDYVRPENIFRVKQIKT